MSDIITVKDMCLWYGSAQALKISILTSPQRALRH